MNAEPAPARGRLPQAHALDGMAVAAAILRLAPSTVRQNVSANDPSLYKSLRRRMFVFDDLERSADEALAQVFSAAELKDAALALRFAAPQLAERALKAVSSRRAELVRTEIAVGEKDRVRVTDIDGAQQRVLAVALALQAAGRIVIDPADPDVVQA